MSRSQRRRGFSLTELLVATTIVAALWALSVPTYTRASRGEAHRSACYTNQKVLAGAVEMYALDFGMVPERLDDDLFQELVSRGYLQAVPPDPGHGRGSHSHYALTVHTGSGITCRVHGSLRAPLERPSVPSSPPPASGTLICGLCGFVLGALAMYVLLRVRERPSPPARVIPVACPLPPDVPIGPPPTPEPDRVDSTGLGPDARCPVCATGLAADPEELVQCRACATPHHQDCYSWNHGCAVYACAHEGPVLRGPGKP